MAYVPKISDEAAKKATGKTWREWFTLLDAAGARRMSHIEIARFIHTKYFGGGRNLAKGPDVAKSGGWWSQMVAVEYERSRGLRFVNQNASGFTVSVHGTFAEPVSKLFSAWRGIARGAKLAEGTMRKNKSIRYNTSKDKPLYVVMFAAKGPKKSRIGFEAMRLRKRSDVERERVKWKKKILHLKRILERRRSA